MCRIVCVPHQEVDEADYGRLVGEIADVGSEFIVLRVDASQFNSPLGTRRQPLNEALEFLERDRLRMDRRAIRKRDVSKSVNIRTRRNSDNE